VLEFSPSLVACCISNANHSFEMIRRSQECVINVPTTDLVNEVIGIGSNCSGAQVDKFKAFGLTPAPATKVSAPLIKECYANFECRLADGSLISKYDLFIWEVVKAHVASSPKYPKTVHYRGQGVFMISVPRLAYVKNLRRSTCETICSSTTNNLPRISRRLLTLGEHTFPQESDRRRTIPRAAAWPMVSPSLNVTGVYHVR